jgi:hypothetical protein
MNAFQFGQSVAQFIKQADDMYNKYQSSGHAGTMSYEDFLEAHDDGPTPPQAPTTPEMPSTPAAPAQPQGGFFSRMGAKADAAVALPGQVAKGVYNWGTRPLNQSYPNTFNSAPKPPNPQWEAQRQNFEGSMF